MQPAVPGQPLHPPLLDGDSPLAHLAYSKTENTNEEHEEYPDDNQARKNHVPCGCNTLSVDRELGRLVVRDCCPSAAFTLSRLPQRTGRVGHVGKPEKVAVASVLERLAGGLVRSGLGYGRDFERDQTRAVVVAVFGCFTSKPHCVSGRGNERAHGSLDSAACTRSRYGAA